MEKRKIVQSGLFSYTVSLPKELLLRYKINKGSDVYISEYGDGLIITPGKADKNPIKSNSECILDVDKFKQNFNFLLQRTSN